MENLFFKSAENMETTDSGLRLTVEIVGIWVQRIFFVTTQYDKLGKRSLPQGGSCGNTGLWACRNLLWVTRAYRILGHRFGLGVCLGKSEVSQKPFI